MTSAQIQVALIFFLPAILFFIIWMIPVSNKQNHNKVRAFMRFAILFTYAPVFYILYGLISTDFDTMAVLDGETVYTMMMGITIMFGIFMMIGAGAGKLYYWLRFKKMI